MRHLESGAWGVLEIPRDTPIEKGADVLERVVSFLRFLDRFHGRHDVVVRDLVEGLRPVEIRSHGAGALQVGAGPETGFLIFEEVRSGVLECDRASARGKFVGCACFPMTL